ncbi:filamentous haemagglutinin family protein [Blastochloris tepida]|uniref:Filamentous haemagglutinin FhaB/tRNA nuclease CdiA-like TPS domain-containing protein n=1 Tax=Blastochloris tepida TaxID=2233851 RepID=A0A348G0S1_9HYPH|nr:filamentous haemagglutinin family protein [Blastochloris tepida]BBF93154.1 hypothetical protein BLTE_18390 [Blastochloris tepida]
MSSNESPSKRNAHTQSQAVEVPAERRLPAATRRAPVGFSACRSHVAVLLCGVSMLALAAAWTPAAARRPAGTSAAASAAAIAAQQAAAAAAQAAQAAQQAQTSLTRAAAGVRAAKAAQAAARALALQNGAGIPDGLKTGGLVPDSGIATDPTLWQGAELPTETVKDGRTVVDINQTREKAILNWETFNVGLKTTLNFNQASADWTVLNRVNDPTAAPSRILGQINAIGGVYVINRNGIIFGGGAQVNVHALVASDMDVGLLGTSRLVRDDFFLNTGIANASNLTTSFSTTYDEYDRNNPVAGSSNLFHGGEVGGGVVVEKGATITTDIVSPDSPGFIYLFGANVANYGTLSASGGEVALVAAQALTITPGAYAAATIPDSVLADGSESFRGTGFEIQHYADRYFVSPDGAVRPSTGSYRAGTGSIINDGLIETPRGITVMNGDLISIGAEGVISADTSISRNSMVLLDAATRVKLDGTISIQPYENGETLPLLSDSSTDGESTVQTFTPAFVEMSARFQVLLGSTGLISAPSAVVSLNARDNIGGTTATAASLTGPQRILLASGATIDVAGLQNVEIPVSYNYISFEPRGTEFADMPLQRDGALVGETLWIDIRETGTRADGTEWVGTPLADASGYVNQVGRSIKQLMTKGGTVSMTTDTNNAGTYGRDVVLEEGSVINVAGGSVRYVGGLVPTTRLVGADGRIYSMTEADPTRVYTGVAGTSGTDHATWGISEAGSGVQWVQEAGYTEGYDAGGIEITTVNPVLTGTLLFGSVAGERQIAAGLSPSDTSGVVPTQSSRDEMPSRGYLKLTVPATVVIGRNGPAALPDGFDATTVLGRQTVSLPAGTNFSVPNVSSTVKAYQTTLSADTVSSWGLSGLILTANNLVVEKGSTVNLAAGGTFKATVGGAIDIAGTISAHAGRISLTTNRYDISALFGTNLFTPPSTASKHDDIFIGGTLDVSGLWVNDTGKTGLAATGSAYIDGGDISIVTSKASVGRDVTGSILLAEDSVLDASSGGYIAASGKAKTAEDGVMAGSGGSISLLLYQGKDWTDGGVGPTLPSSFISTVASLQLDGTLIGYGFERNATLTLAAPKLIQVGGETAGSGVGLHLSEAFLNNGGFGSYVLQSSPDGWSGATAGITVVAGADIALTQKNLSSTANYRSVATGSSIAAVAGLATLGQDLRAPVDLTLASGNILIDAGATITTDPLATITLTGTPTIDSATGLNTVETRATNVLLRGRIIDHGGTVQVHAYQTWLGAQALIDLSGTYIANSRFGLANGPLVSGTMVGGGSFIVEGAQDLDASGEPTGRVNTPTGSTNYVVAESGAVVDVSGYSGTVKVIDTARSTRNRIATTNADWWSDAGTVSINTATFLWGGTFKANATDARANGGTLILGGSAVTLQQNASDVAAALGRIASPTTATDLAAFMTGTTFATLAPYAGQIVAAADSLETFDNVFLYSGYANGGASRIFTALAGDSYGVVAPTLSDLTIKGSLDWSVTNRLHLAAKSITSATADSTVKLAAPYVLLTGGGGTATNTRNSTLTVSAAAIDVESAAFAGFKSVALVSSGDLRLSTPKVVNGLTDAGNVSQDTSRFAGSLVSAGDILLDARRTYVASAVDFTIRTPGKVRFEASAGGRSDVPLSAGGSITVDAATIEQNGYVFAPLGTITLNASTQVTLGAGSRTSVSLGGTVVPYGETLDGTNWFYNTDLYPLETLPTKAVVLNSANVVENAGAVIDLSGGGDLQAMEFVAGKGGTRDVLAGSTTGETVYALLPSSSDSVAAFDVHFTTARSADASGDAYPLAGTQVYLDGSSGVPAGTYTLYPAHYATLPGALRVVYYGDNTGRNIASGTKLADGTVLVSGHYTQSTLSQTRSAGEALFAIQTQAVWSKYSEYTLSGANDYYVAAAAQSGSVVPRLPIDAGRLAIVAQNKVILDGIALTQPAAGGRGGELDLAAGKVAVVSHEHYQQGNVPAGYLGLDVAELNAWGFESVLIGGLRQDTADGTKITAKAANVLIDTGGEALTVPELLLVAQATGELQTVTQSFTLPQVGMTLPITYQVYAPVAGSGTVTIASGSVINATGTVHAGYGRNYYYAQATAAGQTTAADIVNGSSGYPYGLGGTVNGNTITGADFVKLYSGYTGNLRAYSYSPASVQGLGALFVASNDATLSVSGPTGVPVAVPELTISFANAVLPDGRNLGPVSGVLKLSGNADANVGRVAIEGGTTITTAALTAQATARTDAIVIDSGAKLNVKHANLTARSIGIGAGSGDALSLSQANLNQLAAAQSLSLKAMDGAITFHNAGSDVVFDPGAAMEQLTLDARTIAGSGGNATVRVGGTVTLVNTGTAAETAATATGGSLSIEAAEIVLGGGTQTIAGFSQVDWAADERVLVAESGTMKLGSGSDAVGLSVITPNILVAGATATGTGGQFALVTAGNVAIARPAGAEAAPEASTEIGGKFAITAASIVQSGTIQAQAGTVTLRATTGDVVLGEGGYIAAGGYRKTLVDVDTYVAGGKVVLQADAGDVVTGRTSTIDVAQPANGLGYGGEIEVTAAVGRADLQGALLGGGGNGLGGSFKLDTGGAVELDPLADRLLAGGITGMIDIHTREGDLTLSQGHTLKANIVVLTADDASWGTSAAEQAGRITIAGLIDARGYGGTTADGTGEAGGQVALWGANAVVLTASGRIDASTTHTDERGGDVTLGIGAAAKGDIDLQGGTIDVRGGTKGGLTGGTLTLRAPLKPVAGAAGRGDVRIAGLDADIKGARSVTVESYVTFSTDGSVGLDASSLGWNGVIDPANNPFFTVTLTAFAQGGWTHNGLSYGFEDAVARLEPLAQKLGEGVVHLAPGIELVNTNSAINNGDITVASTWNLAAGSAYNLQDGRYVHTYEATDATRQSYVTFDYRYVSSLGIDPGALTLRAAGNININASISDGFFQFRNYLDAGYVSQVATYLGSGRGLGLEYNSTRGYLYQLSSYSTAANAIPVAPYSAAGNGKSPTEVALATADLFPNTLNVCTANCGTAGATIEAVTNPGSWSYRFTAGADVSSANPNAMQPLASVQRGDVIIDGHASYGQPLYSSTGSSSKTVNLSTMVRTGTGSITIAAARDVLLKDKIAPGVIYAAGVNTARLASPSYYLTNGAVVAANPDGFLEPQVLAYGSGQASVAGSIYGPPTEAAFPHQGGDVEVVAQRDIIGYGDSISVSDPDDAVRTSYQYFAPWLLAMAGITPVSSTTASEAALMGAGVYAPIGTSVASGTAWWIQFGSFQQGIMSVGGNVRVEAGRNLVDVSVSLPTTGRVSGGLASLSTGVVSTPVTHLYDSGNMAVRVGGDLLGGAFYEGSGQASIVVRGSVGSAGKLGSASGKTNLPLLAVDTGQINLVAGGAIATAGVINPAELHAQAGSAAYPTNSTVAAQDRRIYMDTYGPDSAVSLTSVSGDITISSPPTLSRYLETLFAGAALYPASLSVIALSGDIITTDMTTGVMPGITLSPSLHGTFQLLAEGSVDLTGGYEANSSTNRPSFSAGPSLLNAAFNPYRPNAWYGVESSDEDYGGAFSRAVLAHADDGAADTIARIYAVTGDIIGVGEVTIYSGTDNRDYTRIKRIEINRPTKIYAGRDIVDLNLIVQNIAADDVSSVVAGRDIYYTGYNNAGGLQVAGPGYLVVEAGRDLGPFLPASGNTTTLAKLQQGIASVGNASVVPVGNSYLEAGITIDAASAGADGSIGMYDSALLGPVVNTEKKRNALLSTTGADLIVLFGVANGVNYDGVLGTYVDPANAANVAHNYLGELGEFLAEIGIGTSSGAEAWAAFDLVSDDLQQVFAAQVFFAELKAVGEAQGGEAAGQYLRGYQAIETFFPASWGYTENELGGGANGAKVQVATGRLDMLHGTIQTQRGGDISILGPGGSILVGSLAKESNSNLKLNDLGIITLGGGDINTFTDGSVLVNSSRVFTELGGNILMWSSNGDLNAGRGAKTTLSQPPLKVVFDEDGYQTIDLRGLVTGAGIGVLKTGLVGDADSYASDSNLYLLAPAGTVDAGDAGIRVSGNLIVAAKVVLNADNIDVGGSSTGVPVAAAPNVGALTAGSAAAAAAAQAGETPTGSTGGGEQASVFIVEVVGYGGGEGAQAPPGDGDDRER